MKLLIAPGVFRYALDSMEVADCIECGVRRVLPEVEVRRLPLADGGEGTVKALYNALGGRLITRVVSGPTGNPVEARAAILEDGTGVMEIADVSDLLAAVQRHRDPLRATTQGTGEMIAALLDEGCRSIPVGIGSGVSGDGGVGMARALGVRFLDRGGNELQRIGDLARLERIDLSDMDRRLGKARIEILTDVRAPLCGRDGAISKFQAPLFRMDEAKLRTIDGGLRRLSQVVLAQLGQDFANQSGMGAAGGLAYGLSVFCSARMQPGVQNIMNRLGFPQTLRDYDMVLTGESDLYHSSNHVSVSTAVAMHAKENHIPVIAFSGQIHTGLEELRRFGLECIINVTNRPMSRADAADEADRLLVDAAERAMRMLLVGCSLAERGAAV